MDIKISKEQVFSVLKDIQKKMVSGFFSNYEWHDFGDSYAVLELTDNSAIPKYIDHTLLDPAADDCTVRLFCKNALAFKFASICVNPDHVPKAFDIVSPSGLIVCSVAGFPLGAHLTAIKAHEAELAIYNGASEIDMVINIGALKSGNFPLVYQDIFEVAELCRDQGAILKVIIETSKLNTKEKIEACLLSKAAGADFVKTSTGMGGGGATVDDVKLMRQVVGPDTGVKASGGIRSLEQALAMIEAGASRIGAGAGDKIAQEAQGICSKCEDESGY